MPDLPDEAVEAAIHALDENPHWASDLAMVQVILTAAAPHIAAQAVGSDHWAHAAITAQDAALTAQINEAVKWGREKDAELTDLRAGVEALRDEWSERTVTVMPSVISPASTERLVWAAATNALDALLREGE